MATELDAEVKTFIVQCLACFDSPSDVVKAVKDVFDVTVTRQAVHHYDAARKGADEIGEHWRKIFDETRKKFLNDTADIPITHKSVRLHWLNEMVISARARGAVVVAAALIEQAAKEVGDAFTNKHKHELTGKDGKDLPAQPAVLIYKPTADGRAPEIKGLPPGTIMLPDNGRD